MPEKPGEGFNKIKFNEEALKERGLLPVPEGAPLGKTLNAKDKESQRGRRKKPREQKPRIQEAVDSDEPQKKPRPPRQRKEKLTAPSVEAAVPSELDEKEAEKQPEKAPKEERLIEVLTEGDKRHLERIYKDMTPEEVEQFQKTLLELDTRRIRMQIKDRLVEALGPDPASLSKEELAERIQASGIKDFETVARRLYGIKNPEIEEFRKEVLVELGLEYDRGLFGDRRKREAVSREAQGKHLPEDLVRAEEGIKFAYQEYFENVLKNFHEKGALSVDPEIYQKMGAIDAEAVAMFGKKRLQEMREEIARERGFHYETLEEMLEAQRANVREPVFVKSPEGMRSPEETAALTDRDIEEAYDSIREEKKRSDFDGFGTAIGANIEEADLKAAEAERERDLKNFEAGPGKLAEQEYSERLNKRFAEEALKDEPLYEKEAAGREAAAPAEGTPEYAEAKRNLDSAKENYQRILNDKNSDPVVRKDALRRYLEARNEFVGDDVSRYVSEMLEDLKEKTKRKEGIWEYALGFSKKLGEMNLSKTNWEWVKKLEEWGKVPEKKLKLWGNKTFTVGGWSLGGKIAKGVNARTAIAGGLLGLAWPAALVAGATGAAGALGLSAAFRGGGAMMGSYEALRKGQQMLTNVTEKDVAVYEDEGVVDANNPDLSFARMSAAEVEEKLLGLIARARMNASWDQYKKPIEILAKRYQENLESAVKAGYDLGHSGQDIKHREAVFAEKKKRAKNEEILMRGGAIAAGTAAAGSAVGFGRIGSFFKGLFGVEDPHIISDQMSNDMLAHEWNASKMRHASLDTGTEDMLDHERASTMQQHASGEAIAADDMLDHERGSTMQRLRPPKVTDFSGVFSAERIAIEDWDRLRENPADMLDHERGSTMMEHSSVDPDTEDMLDHESAASRQAQLVPREVEPESPPDEETPEAKRVLSRRELIGSSGLRPEYYELVKDMSAEEYLEKKGMPLNPKNGFPLPKVDGEYPWISQDRLAHNRWMDYERLKERMQEVIKSMPPDEKINAMKGMTVEEFIKGHLGK